MSKNNKKRAHMLQKKNAKIVYLDTKEAWLMYELLVKTNDVFKALRKKGGGDEINFEEAQAIIKKFQTMMLRTSDVLNLISNKTAKDYNEPFIFAKIQKR